MNPALAMLSIFSAFCISAIAADNSPAVLPGENRSIPSQPGIGVQTTLPGASPSAQQSRPNVEQRLAEIELSAALKQYEKILLLKHDAELESALLSFDKTPDSKERGDVAHRLVVLGDQAEGLRKRALSLGVEIRLSSKREKLAGDQQRTGQ